MASEARQASIRALGERITATPCPADVVQLCEQKLALLEAEGCHGACWDTMACAMQYLQLTGERKRARIWAKRAAKNARQALGQDSQEYQALLVACSN